MTRLRLHFPEPPMFSYTVSVRITDLNYGNHLGHDTLVSLLHEARARFFKFHEMHESNVDGSGIILTELEVMYKKQVLYGQELLIEMAVGNIQTRGLDFYYRVTDTQTQAVHALARTGLLFFDYDSQRPVRAPERFSAILKDQLDGTP